MSLDRGFTLTYLGHSTVLIDTPAGKRILIDPWLAGNPACPEAWKSPERLGKLDLLLMTHLHNDHVGDAQAVVQAFPEVPVVGIYEACNWIARKGARNPHPMNKGGSQNVAGVEIAMTHAFHSSSYQEPDGSIVYGGEPVGYLLKLENGFSLYAAGDTALFGDMALLQELYKPDLALLPIGDLFTMGPKQAAVAIKLLGVNHVVPLHFGTFPALTGTPEALQAECRHLPDVQIHTLKPGESLN